MPYHHSHRRSTHQLDQMDSDSDLYIDDQVLFTAQEGTSDWANPGSVVNKESADLVRIKARRPAWVGHMHVRMSLFPNFVSLSGFLSGNIARQQLYMIQTGGLSSDKISIETGEQTRTTQKTRHVILVDSNYRPTHAETALTSSRTTRLYPGAIGMAADAAGRRTSGMPIYNDANVAARELFGLHRCSLVRVTRAAGGSQALLKLETAHPGDSQLNDIHRSIDGRGAVMDRDAIGERHEGTDGDFVHSVVLRGEYREGIRVYLLPRNTNVILYLEESMLRRDILKGDFDFNAVRLVLTTFDWHPLFRELRILA